MSYKEFIAKIEKARIANKIEEDQKIHDELVAILTKFKADYQNMLENHKHQNKYCVFEYDIKDISKSKLEPMIRTFLDTEGWPTDKYIIDYKQFIETVIMKVKFEI